MSDTGSGSGVYGQPIGSAGKHRPVVAKCDTEDWTVHLFWSKCNEAETARVLCSYLYLQLFVSARRVDRLSVSEGHCLRLDAGARLTAVISRDGQI